jgi:uncharacterized protein GlcG (DUF336 family)
MLTERCHWRHLGVALLSCGFALALGACGDDDDGGDGVGFGPPQTEGLPSHEVLRTALQEVVAEGAAGNGGFGLNMWATVVDRSGIVVAVAFSGPGVGDQWLLSRAISAQKASTANGLSLNGLALSTANLWAATQPGGSLFGLQESNPVDHDVAYAGDVATFGTTDDPMTGKRVGGVNVFGGGFALYNSAGERIGGIGVSGDSSCADHNIAWKARDQLGLDFVPAGVSDGGTTDNIIYDIGGDGVSVSGFGHPECSILATQIGQQLPTTHPLSGPPAT